MNTEIIKFNATDSVILDGILNKCENKTDKILIQIHGMTSNCFKNRDKMIANKVVNLNIDTLCFNNRGSEIIKYCKKENGEKILQGTAYENAEDSYYDIVGAIQYVVSLGYKKIYLQGHSLGSTKIVYTYNKLLKENNPYLQKEDVIWKEVLLIGGWVPIWETIDIELFSDLEGRRKRIILKRLLESEIIEK